MRISSVRDLHIRTSELIREAEEGDTIVIERRGRPVAELRPVGNAPGIPADTKARIFADMKKIWARMPLTNDSTRMIEEDRDR